MIFFYWLILIMPLENHPLWGYFIGPLTVVKYLGLLCIIYAILHLLSRRNPPSFFGTWQARLFILFYLIVILSYVFMGNHAGIEVSPFLMYTSFALLFFVTLTVVDSLKRLRWVLLAAVGSIGISSIYVLREWQKSGFQGGVRPGWIGGGTDDYAISPLLCLPIAFCLLREHGARLERLYCLGCLVLGTMSVIFGASRGGFIGAGISLLYLIWRSRRRARNVGLLFIMVIPLLIVTPSSPIRRLINPGNSDQMSTANHVGTLKAGLRMFAAHPVFGVGLGNFQRDVLHYAGPNLMHAFIAHNVYLEVAAEMGIPALLTYVLMIGFTFKALGKLERTAAEPYMRAAALGVRAGFLGASVGLFFVSAESNKLYWLFVFLSMCMPTLAKSSASQAGRSSINKPNLPQGHDGGPPTASRSNVREMAPFPSGKGG